MEKTEHFWKKPLVSRIYYGIKPLIPRGAQILVRRFFFRRALPGISSFWPIDPAAAQPPEGWTGWPEGKRFALVLTHDVESQRGLDRCRHLAAMEMELGFRSSFNFLLKKYSTPKDLRSYLVENGFEIGIHGCYHDGKKFNSREIFMERAAIINQHLEDWKSCGFRAPAMQCNLDWIGDLNIEYDLSTFDTDPFEAQDGGARTIYPFMVERSNGTGSFVELPYTLPQDSTLFILLGERNIDIWKKKLDWIVANEGMALVNVHPDYMAFGGSRPGVDEYPSQLYEDFLHYIRDKYEKQFYHCLPRELAYFCSKKDAGMINK
jgi:peptidoglycan/xylan/chitin deacetylase (PgdA/CDA1 family)